MPFDIDDCTMNSRSAICRAVSGLLASTANGKITYVDIGTFRWFFTLNEMRGL